jgi:protein SCO1/2
MFADSVARSKLLRGLWLAVMALCLVLVGCGESKKNFASIDITGAEFGKDFAFIDGDSKPVTLAQFKGQAVVLFFGYTQCPDVCPTTMTEVAEAKRLLGEKGDKVVGLFVTLDPERDTAQVLKNYTANFGPQIIGARVTSPEQLAAVTKDFRVYFKKVDGKSPGSYTLDHTAASFVYDPQGRLRLYTRYGMGAQSLAADLAQIL